MAYTARAMQNLFCVQFDIAWEDPPANRKTLLRLLEAAAPPKNSLVLAPEMFSTGFTMDPARAEDNGTATAAMLSEAARSLGIFLLAGIVARDDNGRCRNQAACFDPQGREIARYTKMHPFTPAGEDQHCVAGAAPVVFDWLGMKVAPFICYDLRFPEVFRAAVRLGAELFAVIANWPASREHHWITLLQARAIENQAYVAGANRCGADPAAHYSGRSLIVDPRGRALADAGTSERIIHARVGPSMLRVYRGEFPVLADMR